MKNLLYIGNNLDHNRSNLSSIRVLGPLLEQEGYVVYYSSSKSHKGRRLLDMLWACVRLRKKIDLVLMDTYSTQNFYYALLVSQLCRLLKVPYVPNLNGGNLPYRLKHNPRLSQLIFGHAHCCVSPSLYLHDAFKSYGYGPIYYIPNALKLENYQYRVRGPIKEVKLLWVRSFAKIYNPTLAVEVLNRLKMEGISAELCMVGPDSDGSLSRVKAYAKELGMDVQFTGKLSKTAWTELAQEYNVFINTTNFDNMPVSVMEAMALGLPIVSTNVGGIPYLIQHETEGLLVPPNNAQAFVMAIKRLIYQPVSTKTMVFNAREKAKQFDWNSVRHRWHEVLSH